MAKARTTIKAAPPAPTHSEFKVAAKTLERALVPLYGQAMGMESVLTALMKGDNSIPSAQGVTVGQKPHPFDRVKVKELQLRNEYHSTCIHAKVASTVGLGFLSEEERKARQQQEQASLVPQNPAFTGGDTMTSVAAALAGGSWKTSKVDEILDPLCTHSIADVLSSVAEDFWQVGDGYMEVVRANPGTAGLGPITGLHHIPADEIWLNVENTGYDQHFDVYSTEGTTWQRKFARFGDLADFITRSKNGLTFDAGFSVIRGNNISEVIHFRRPSSLSRWYGFPDWLSAVAAIELMTCLRQWKYDFFNNRGVPEYLLWVLGQELSQPQWDLITKSLNATVGRGNQHKSLAMNLANPNIKIQLDKLGVDSSNGDALDLTNETYALAIVSSHGVPPLLAGILVPGRLGSANELPNALRAFQALRVGPAQRLFQQRLGTTLGNSIFNGGLDLTVEDFTLRSITDEIDVGTMDTSANMRQSEPAAAAQGRDLSRGLKK